MSDLPLLSICVPSRNRQDCLQQTVRDLLASPRDDIEIVVADNSDDPSVMNDFMATMSDPRLRYLPSADRMLSMGDNWERTVEATTGAWVNVIGDDDYVDPEVADLIRLIVARDPAVEAISWNRAAFQWPGARSVPKSVTISLANRIMRSPHHLIMDRMFGWLGATHVPMCPFGIYHSAVSRASLERVRTQFSGRWFEHPVVDYDFAHKLLTSSQNLVFIDRPMSILGVAAASNSAAVGKEAQSQEAQKAYYKEYGDGFERATIAAGFPFTVKTGVAGCIMGAQFWFKNKYGFRFENWQGNFTLALAHESRLWQNRAEFDTYIETCRAAFEIWEGGKYLPHFKPEFHGDNHAQAFFGLNRRELRINQEIAGVETPAEIYRLMQSILPDMADLNFEF